MAINSRVGSHFFTFALEHSVKISKFPVLSWYQRTVLSTPLLFSSLSLHDDPNVLIPAANYDPNTQIQRRTKAQLTHCQAVLIHFPPLRGDLQSYGVQHRIHSQLGSLLTQLATGKIQSVICIRVVSRASRIFLSGGRSERKKNTAGSRD